jgi:hypothetical protein
MGCMTNLVDVIPPSCGFIFRQSLNQSMAAHIPPPSFHHPVPPPPSFLPVIPFAFYRVNLVQVMTIITSSFLPSEPFACFLHTSHPLVEAPQAHRNACSLSCKGTISTASFLPSETLALPPSYRLNHLTGLLTLCRCLQECRSTCSTSCVCGLPCKAPLTASPSATARGIRGKQLRYAPLLLVLFFWLLVFPPLVCGR